MTEREGTAVVEPPPWGQVPSGFWVRARNSRALSTAASTWGGTGSSTAAREALGIATKANAATRQATARGRRRIGRPGDARQGSGGRVVRSSGSGIGGLSPLRTPLVLVEAGDADVIVLDHLAVRRRAR